MGGQKLSLGGSVHMKSTFALGDPSKSTVGVEASADAKVSALGHEVGGTAGNVGLQGDLQGNYNPTLESPSLTFGGGEQSLGSDAATTFGAAEYEGVGGGASLSVSTQALQRTWSDFTSLIGVN